MMFPIMESLNDVLKDSPKDSFGRISSIKSMKRKSILSQIRNISFASVPDSSSSEESKVPKTPPRSTNVETNPENKFLYPCLKFPNLKGSGTMAEDDKGNFVQVSLGEILSIIEPISKQMEEDKKHKVEPSRFFDATVAPTSQSLLSSPVIYNMPFVKEDEKDLRFPIQSKYSLSSYYVARHCARFCGWGKRGNKQTNTKPTAVPALKDFSLY
uniref:Uncharacterized protein LOC110213668 n=1 Tax=Phascolarctos cinereus TaxID=38626 RepID=A0A6P5KVC6_PHACI|nr:uncharacterized protein LOC110213668 [Phascolarctos cinereus]